MHINVKELLDELRDILPADLQNSADYIESALSEVSDDNITRLKNGYDALNMVIDRTADYFEVYAEFFETRMKPLFREFREDYYVHVKETYTRFKFVNYSSRRGATNNLIGEDVFICIKELVIGKSTKLIYWRDNSEYGSTLTTNVCDLIDDSDKKELSIQTINSTYTFSYFEEFPMYFKDRLINPEEVMFLDKEFERAVRKAIDMEEGPIRSQNLKAINGIVFSNEDGTGLPIPWQADSSAFNMTFPNLFFNVSNSEKELWTKDLALFEHIKSLHIYTDTESLEFIKDFRKLKELYIIKTKTQSWSFIEELISLEYLCIQDSTFKDLKVLERLYEKQVVRYKALKSISSSYHVHRGYISHLFLVNCGIESVEGLRKCDYLMDVNLSRNNIKDIEPLTAIGSLYYLTLRYNKVEDITPFSFMKGLYYLNVRHNKVKDISVFNTNKNGSLSRLFLVDNPIEDYSPLKGWQFVVSDIEEYTREEED